MIAPDALNAIYQASLQTYRQWTAGVLDAGESAWKLQMDAADELCHTAFAQWRATSGEVDTSNPLAVAPAALSQSLEHSTRLMRGYIDTTIKLQKGLAQIAESQMPMLSRTLGEMWLAPLSGIAPAAAESLRRSMEQPEARAKKAA